MHEKAVSIDILRFRFLFPHSLAHGGFKFTKAALASELNGKNEVMFLSDILSPINKIHCSVHMHDFIMLNACLPAHYLPRLSESWLHFISVPCILGSQIALLMYIGMLFFFFMC